MGVVIKRALNARDVDISRARAHIPLDKSIFSLLAPPGRK